MVVLLALFFLFAFKLALPCPLSDSFHVVSSCWCSFSLPSLPDSCFPLNCHQCHSIHKVTLGKKQKKKQLGHLNQHAHSLCRPGHYHLPSLNGLVPIKNFVLRINFSALHSGFNDKKGNGRDLLDWRKKKIWTRTCNTCFASLSSFCFSLTHHLVVSVAPPPPAPTESSAG